MGHDLRSLCQVEARRFICLVGIVFATLILIQYLELPYGNFIFAANKVPINGTVSTSPTYKIGANTTFLNSLNSTEETVAIHDKTPEEDSDPEDEAPSKDFVEENKNSTTDTVNKWENDGYAPEKAMQPEDNLLVKNGTENGVNSNIDFASPSPALSPISLSHNLTSQSPTNLYTNSDPPVIATPILKDDENRGPSLKNNNSSPASAPAVKKKKWYKQTDAVVSISEMNDMFKTSRASYHSMKPRWSLPADQELSHAKSEILNAPIVKDSKLYAPIYWNVSKFKRSYDLMEQTLKVYIYKEGERPVFHQPPLKGIYASEGWFMKLLEANKHFVTKNPREAHLFYLPFSSRALEESLYVPNSHSHTNLIQYLKNYLDMIGAKYPFWNRTGGADHFLVACHDWAPAETRQYMANCIRAICNNDIQEGFIIGKDVSLPETYVKAPQNPLRDIGGKPASNRPILAFFAGSMHGNFRQILLDYWKDKDPDMKIFGKMPRPKKGQKGQMSYIQHMKSSKYCICAKGYEVNSPRIVEAILYECVPVIISDNFVPPFFETLNWESFAVFISEKDVPDLKKILLAIPRKRYFEMQRRVIKVQQHFLWHARPEKYDIFHMILHSIWYNRVFSVRPR